MHSNSQPADHDHLAVPAAEPPTGSEVGWHGRYRRDERKSPTFKGKVTFTEAAKKAHDEKIVEVCRSLARLQLKLESEGDLVGPEKVRLRIKRKLAKRIGT